MKLLEGKIAIITGATRGIGRGIAEVFAKNGANIAFTYVSSDEKAKIAAVTNVFNNLDVRKHATAEKAKYLDKAYFHLNSIEVEDDKKKVLKTFAKMLVDREV